MASGLHPGQTLADALAHEPRLALADADPVKDLEALEALADWCVRFSPAVAVDAPDGLMLDVTGAVGLWADEATLLADLRARFAAADIPVQAAIADSRGAAWALARFGADGAICAGAAMRAALRALPVAALRLDLAVAAQLLRLGLATIGQLEDLPPAVITRRFGPAARLRLDQAMGRVGEPLLCRRPPAPFEARLRFMEPISAPEDLERVTRDLLELMSGKLTAAGQGARRFELLFHRVDGRTLTLAIGTALAGRDPARLLSLLRARLDGVDPGFGVEAATLLATEVQPLRERQADLDDPSRLQAMDEAKGVAALIDQLVNRLGEGRVWRPDPVETWTPEAAVARVDPLTPPAQTRWPVDRPRPVRLFARPEPIDAVALTPDDPPSSFRWRGLSHRVARAEGPERLGRPWWRRADDPDRADPARLRDYYRVEDMAGRRFWIFRAGLYEPQRPARWFLHGLFP